MIALIGSVIGWIIWITCLILVVFVIRDKKINVFDKFIAFILTFVVLGGFGLSMCYEGMFKPQKNIVITYEMPSSIVKTNNLTLVNHISKEGKVLVSLQSSDVKYWNSTNIMVEVKSGKNFYGYEVGNKYEVVLK